MASCDWLKLAALCLFRAQSVSRNKSICQCAEARPQSDGSALLSNSILMSKLGVYLIGVNPGHRAEYRVISEKNTSFQ